MKRLALLLVAAVCLAIAPLPAGGQISAKLVMEDQRSSDYRVYLRHEFTTGKDLIRCEAYLPKGDVPLEQSWELLFETAEVLRRTVDICKYNSSGTKVMVHGREVQTIRGRGLLIDSIKSNW
jgi:hypothetical protein